MRTLSRLLATSFAKYKQSLQGAINAMCEQQQGMFDKDRAILARKIMVLVSRYDSMPAYPGSCLNSFSTIDYRQKREFIASLCDFDADAVDAFTFGRASENFEEAKTGKCARVPKFAESMLYFTMFLIERFLIPRFPHIPAWCPNSAQRIPGRFHAAGGDHHDGWLGGAVDSSVSLPELRVNWQWEVLLGTTLVASCRDVTQSESEEDVVPEVHKAIIEAENWLGVCESAVSCLMPAAALLRFGLSRGGRKSHPLASEDETTNNDQGGIFRHFELEEKLPVSVTASKQLRELTSETVALLARFSGQCAGDMPISLSCHAVASNLLIDCRSFEHLRGFEALRFALTTLTELRQENWTIAAKDRMDEGMELSKAPQFLAERITAVVEFWGRDSERGSDQFDTLESSSVTFGRLMALLTSSKCFKLDTISENGVEASSMLSLLDGKELDADTISRHESEWTWNLSHAKTVSAMISLLCSGTTQANLRTKGCISMMLSCLASMEYKKLVEQKPCKFQITNELVKAFNSSDEAALTGLLSSIACTSSDAIFQKETCSLLAYLVCARVREQIPFSKVSLVVQHLLASMAQWIPLKSKSRDSILDLLLLFGSCSNNLTGIGSALLEYESDEMETGDEKKAEKLEAIAKFFRYLQGLRSELNKDGKGKDPPAAARASPVASDVVRSRLSEAVSSSEAKNDKNAPKPPPPSCSYALKSGFHGQHWYNCYTCGLTWDKGCCSLCALVCHEGHDVSYSRYSSFFCDCGAEDGGDNDPSRVSCKCLSTIVSLIPSFSQWLDLWLTLTTLISCHAQSQRREYRVFSRKKGGPTLRVAIMAVPRQKLRMSLDVRNRRGFISR